MHIALQAFRGEREEGKWVDELTGISSRAAFYRDAKARVENVGIVVVDVDNMTEINEQRGCVMGDEILVKVARLLSECFVESRLYRMGSDEFCVVASGMDRAAFVDDAMNAAFDLDRGEFPVSLGYAWSEGTAEVVSLMRRAMNHLRQAKRARVVSFNAGQNLSLVKDLSCLLRPQGAAEAVRAGAFSVWMQPQVCPHTCKIIGAESLVRYVEPRSSKMIPLAAFVGPLEDMGEIDEIDFFVFEQVCAFVARREKQGHAPCKVSVNFSRRTIEKPPFANQVERVAASYGVKPALLEIEVTESASEADPEAFARIINDLRCRGFVVAIDDFGTGSSNLALFGTIAFDVLKLDKALIDKIAFSPPARKVVELVAQLCLELGIETVAEGVEDARQLSIVRSVGLTRVQGYHTGRPVPLVRFEEMLTEDSVENNDNRQEGLIGHGENE